MTEPQNHSFINNLKEKMGRRVSFTSAINSSCIQSGWRYSSNAAPNLLRLIGITAHTASGLRPSSIFFLFHLPGVTLALLTALCWAIQVFWAKDTKCYHL